MAPPEPSRRLVHVRRGRFPILGIRIVSVDQILQDDGWSRLHGMMMMGWWCQNRASGIMRGGSTRDENAIGARRPGLRSEDELLRSRRGGRKGARASIPLPYPAPTGQAWEMEDNASRRHWRTAGSRHAGMQTAEQREIMSWDAGGVPSASRRASWRPAGPEQQLRRCRREKGTMHRAQQPGALWQPVSRSCRYQGLGPVATKSFLHPRGAGGTGGGS